MNNVNDHCRENQIQSIRQKIGSEPKIHRIDSELVGGEERDRKRGRKCVVLFLEQSSCDGRPLKTK